MCMCDAYPNNACTTFHARSVQKCETCSASGFCGRCPRAVVRNRITCELHNHPSRAMPELARGFIKLLTLQHGAVPLFVPRADEHLKLVHSPFSVSYRVYTNTREASQAPSEVPQTIPVLQRYITSSANTLFSCCTCYNIATNDQQLHHQIRFKSTQGCSHCSQHNKGAIYVFNTDCGKQGTRTHRTRTCFACVLECMRFLSYNFLVPPRAPSLTYATHIT
jgi:hypothetical protein